MQAGGQRFDPAQLHQNSFTVSRSPPSFGDADLETGQQHRQVFTASGRAFLKTNKTVWMFDNKIDWVKRIWRLFLVPAAARQLEG